MRWPTKKLGIGILAVVLITFAYLFLKAEQYWVSFFTLSLLVILIRIDDLKKIALNKAGFEADFENIKEEKVKKEIKENNEIVTSEKVKFYQNTEHSIIEKIHQKLGGRLFYEMRFIYSYWLKPEFVFMPDAIIIRDNEAIIIEVKLIFNIKLARKIIESASKILKLHIDKMNRNAPLTLTGEEIRAKGKLIIASYKEIDISDFPKYNDIDFEFYHL